MLAYDIEIVFDLMTEDPMKFGGATKKKRRFPMVTYKTYPLDIHLIYFRRRLVRILKTSRN